MILLYTMLLFLLNTIKHLVGLRARALERKFMRVAAAVKDLAAQGDFKPGNSGKPDTCANAKRMLLLGQQVQERDQVEAKYFAWQRWTDRCNGWSQAVRGWQGKKLPYTLGAVDVWMVFTLVDYLGVGEYISLATLIQMAASLYRE